MTLLQRNLKRKREKREHLQQFLDSCAQAEGCAVLRKISRIVAATGKRGTTS